MAAKKERVAGRELDAEIAERVMGWTWVTFDSEKREWLSPCVVGAEARSHPAHRVGDGSKRRDLSTLPRFSTDIDPAFRVVAKLNEGRWFVDVGNDPDGDKWHCYVGAFAPVVASTPALAICLAALAAIEAPPPAKRSADLSSPSKAGGRTNG